MKLNQEWKQQWESIEVPELEITKIIEQTSAEPKKLTLIEKIKTTVTAIKPVKLMLRRRT